MKKENHGALESLFLVVEDDLSLEPLLTKAIRSLDSDATFVWVTTAEEAKLALMQKQFTMVISDHVLDGHATGIELWKFCKKHSPSTPFLLISGLGTAEFHNLLADFKAGPAYIQKPIYIDECKKAIQECLIEQSFRNQAEGEVRHEEKS